MHVCFITYDEVEWIDVSNNDRRANGKLEKNGCGWGGDVHLLILTRVKKVKWSRVM